MDEATKEKLINSLKDVHGYVEIQIPTYLYIILGLILISAISYFLWKRFRKDTVKDGRSKTEIILDELNSLEQETNSEKFYLRYADLMREYFDFRFETNLNDKTTKEIKKVIYQFKEINSNEAKLFTKSLERADLAKFAKKEFKGEEKLQDLYDALQLIKSLETKLSIQVNEEEELKI